jgi:predicted DNA-binding transcriptional regulator AlpA
MPSSRVVLDAVATGQLRLKDLAELLDLTPQRVRQLIEQVGFPEPVAVHGRSRLWDRADVDRWMAQRKWKQAKPWRSTVLS